MANKKDIEKIICVWDSGGKCGGETKKRKMFSSKLDGIPSCDDHMEVHRKIMFLFNNKFEIEKIVDMDLESITKQVQILQLSGVAENKNIL